jgi:hypothetical protein
MPVLLKMQFLGETCPLSRRFVTLNTWIRSLDSLFGICVAQSGAGPVFFPTLMLSLSIIIQQVFYIRSSVTPEMTSGLIWVTYGQDFNRFLE